MRLIPKTFKAKPVIKNHITLDVAIVLGMAAMGTVMMGFNVVHHLLTIPTFLINGVGLWLVSYPSKWDKDKTRAEIFLLCLFFKSHKHKVATKGKEFRENEAEESIGKNESERRSKSY